MPVMPSRFPVKYSVSKWKSFCFLVLTLALGTASGWAQAPPIVIDAQQTLGFGYGQPQGIAVSKNGTVFIADTNNNQIIALDTFPPGTGINNTVPTPGFTLSSPQVLALDASGNLFVGDVPTNGTGRLIEIMGDGNGNLTATVKLVLSGAPLTDPFALVFDNTGTLFIGDYPASGHGVIYTLAPGSSTPQLLNITGLPVEFTPASFARDAGNNLYIADNGNLSNGPGGVWVAPATGGGCHASVYGVVYYQPAHGFEARCSGQHLHSVVSRNRHGFQCRAAGCGDSPSFAEHSIYSAKQRDWAQQRHGVRSSREPRRA